MNLLDHWFVQAIVGNIAFYILSKLFKILIKHFTNPNPKKKTYYSKSIIRTQFYISLSLIFIIMIFNSYTPLKENQNCGYIISIVLWALFFLISAFECSLEQTINKKIINRKSERNKHNS